MPQPLTTPYARRIFVIFAGIALGLASPALSANGPETIREAIDHLVSLASESPYEQTVDTAKTGDLDRPLTGVVTTFMPNVEVIRRAIALEANLIVSHEPVFYNHLDSTEWLEGNSVYEYKRKLIEEHGIVVFRYHDYLHSLDPDPVFAALTKRLEWDAFRKDGNDRVFELPPVALRGIVEHLERKLGVGGIRYVGEPDAKIAKVGLLPGAPGGRRQIEFMEASGVELLITGEVHEWEVSEYVRDGIAAGRNVALVVLGHQPSEEDGMEWLARKLESDWEATAVTHVVSNSPFRY